jgi:nucleoside-diphosphate-sugar epimerase
MVKPLERISGRRFLVTGGTGFLGSALVRALVAAGARVRVLDDGSRGSHHRVESVRSAIEVVDGDVRDAAAVRAAVRGVDCVCHLAYINGTKYFYSDPDLVLDVAVKGMTNVLDSCVAEGVRELVLASSSEVYQTADRVPTDESVPLSIPDPLNPRYSYGGGKIISELMAINAGRRHFDRVLIFRPHNVYGPDMGTEHVVPQLAIRMRDLAKQPGDPLPFPIQGTGNETRAFVYIDDLVAGVLKIIESGQHLGIYHVGTEEEITIATLAEKIGRYFGREVSIVPGALQPGGTLRRCPDITRLRKLGYSPRYTIDDGLALTLPWYARADGAQS